MPRNKSEKPAALAPVSATTLGGMSAVVRKYDEDIQALLELVEEARREAAEWRMIALDVESGRTPRIFLSDEERRLPWEEDGA